MKKQFTEVIKLHNQGYSADQIVEETGASRATVYRWIEQHEASLTLAGVDQDHPGEEVSHLALTGFEKAASSIERANDLKEREDEVNNKKNERAAVRDFKKLMEGLKEHTAGSTWSKEEIRKVLNETDDILELVHDVCTFHGDECSDLSIFEITTIVKTLFKNYLYNYSDGLKVQWDSAKLEMIESGLGVEEFDDVSFDTADYYRQTAYLIFIGFIDQLLAISGILSVEEADDLISELKRTKEALTDDLNEDLSDEFESELSILSALEDFLKEYRIRTEEAFFGKRFFLPEEIKSQIAELQTQPQNGDE
jgi:hypothetical protein